MYTIGAFSKLSHVSARMLRHYDAIGLLRPAHVDPDTAYRYYDEAQLSTLIQTIPGPVIGGISFLLYGMIGTSGLRILVDAQVDYSKNRNQALTSVIFVAGLSGIALKIGSIQLTGMVLACVVGMVMSLVIYLLDRAHLTNDQD